MKHVTTKEGTEKMSSNANSKNKALTWQALCLMAYTVVWGFGNTVNGFANQGLKVVVSWMILFLFYFIPYTLMVGEMGATFENGAGGVSSWIKEACSSKLAFFAGWTFWVVNIPYLAQKPQNILIALGWAIFQNDQLTHMISPLMLQLISLGIFMFFILYPYVWTLFKGNPYPKIWTGKQFISRFLDSPFLVFCPLDMFISNPM